MSQRKKNLRGRNSKPRLTSKDLETSGKWKAPCLNRVARFHSLRKSPFRKRRDTRKFSNGWTICRASWPSFACEKGHTPREWFCSVGLQADIVDSRRCPPEGGRNIRLRALTGGGHLQCNRKPVAATPRPASPEIIPRTQ